MLSLADGPQHPPKRTLGNSRSRCGGCVVMPKDGHHSLYVAGLVLFPVVVFLVTVVPGGEIFSYVIIGSLTLIDITCLLLCSTVDPGVLIPAARHNAATAAEFVSVNGVAFECKVCTTCNIVRPPRSSHCSVCDWCVEEFDHHCGVVGSCVAKRTFRFFTFFLILTTVIAAYIAIRSIVVLAKMDFSLLSQSNRGRWNIVASVGCVVYCGIGGLCVVGQASFYTYLGCTNLTQKEQQRREPSNPFDEGFIMNCWLRFIQPLSKSRLLSPDVREFV